MSKNRRKKPFQQKLRLNLRRNSRSVCRTRRPLPRSSPRWLYPRSARIGMVSPFLAIKAAGRLRSRPVQCAHWAARGRLTHGSRPALTGAARRLTLPQAGETLPSAVLHRDPAPLGRDAFLHRPADLLAHFLYLIQSLPPLLGVPALIQCGHLRHVRQFPLHPKPAAQ